MPYVSHLDQESDHSHANLKLNIYLILWSNGFPHSPPKVTAGFLLPSTGIYSFPHSPPKVTAGFLLPSTGVYSIPSSTNLPQQGYPTPSSINLPQQGYLPFRYSAFATPCGHHESHLVQRALLIFLSYSS